MTIRVDDAPRETYYGDGRQPWDDIVAGGFGAEFAAGSILKYLRRTKGERAKDLEKARWYWARILEMQKLKSGYVRAEHAHLWLQKTLTPDEWRAMTGA